MTEEEEIKEKQKQMREYYRSIYDVKTWLNLHITQTNYTRNLILTFSIATLAYSLNQYSNSVPKSGSAALFYLSFFNTGIAIVFGLLMEFYQSQNFRSKRKISRIIEKDENFDDTNEEFQKLVRGCDADEEAIRLLSYGQLTFFLGALIPTAAAIIRVKFP